MVLDLKGFTLKALVPQTNDIQYYGISVVGHKDVSGTPTVLNAVTIQNGTVSGVTYAAINAIANTNLQISNMILSDISFYEITTPDLTPCGIFIESTEVFNIQSCQVKNMSVTTPSCAGIQIIQSANGNVSDVTMTQFLNKDGAVQGFSYLSSTNITTDNSAVSNFQSGYLGLTNTTGHTVLGFVPIFCTNLEFNDCSANTMKGCCDDCHGMSVFLNSYVEVNNFTATNIIDGLCAVNTGAKATGLEVYGDYITINHCTSENIMAIVPQDLQAAGFSAWGNNITFNNCTAKNVQVTDAKQQPNTIYGYGTGFGWAPDPRTEFCKQVANQVQYNNCNTYDSQLGFDTWYHTNSQWNNVMSYNCPIFILAQPDTAQRTLSMDRCSESPTGQPLQVTITNLAANNTYPQLHT